MLTTMRTAPYTLLLKKSPLLLLALALISASHQDQTASNNPLPPLITIESKTNDIYRKRFGLPRAVFTHGNMVKPGVISALKGQDNFLPLYIAAIERGQTEYQAEGFSYTILVPDFVQILDQEKNGLVITRTKFKGKNYQKIERQLDPKKLAARCLKAAYGLEETLWYRLDESKITADSPLLRITLNYQGKPISRAEARLQIFDELETPQQVSPENFKFYLASGPLFRKGHYDQFAEMQRKAGFNTLLLFSNDVEPIKEMKKTRFLCHRATRRQLSQSTTRTPPMPRTGTCMVRQSRRWPNGKGLASQRCCVVGLRTKARPLHQSAGR